MFLISITDAQGQSEELTVPREQALIGRASHCTVRLTGWRIGREHARVVRSTQGLMLEDLGQFSGTWVNGVRVSRFGPLQFSDQIQILGYRLRLRDLLPGRPLEALSPTPPEPADSSSDCPDPLAQVEPDAAGGSVVPSEPDLVAMQARQVAQRHAWRKRVHDQLLDTIDLRRRDLMRMTDAELRDETEKLLREILDTLTDLPISIDRATLSREVLNEAVGLGPLEDLLADDSVTEIMVNKADEIFVERGGRLTRHALAFSSDRAIQSIIERIVTPLGRRIDESSPLVDARLRDGSRVNAVIAPLALKGPALTIRKFSSRRLQSQDMVAFGSVSPPMMSFLKLCVEQRKNLVVSGGTGSGKTTLLNVLSNFIPTDERIITIEDAAELRLNHVNLVSLESRPANAEGRGAVTIRDLVKNALRMRPDRIVVGECRGGEALDMLQAMNTGHEGSMTTLHANTARDALARLETLILMAGMDLPVTAIRDQIAAAVDIVVQQSRFACGSRKVTSVTEVTGVENGRILMQELFRFEQVGQAPDGKVQGRFVGCKAVPSFYDQLRGQGTELDLSLFEGIWP
jgi:pilus assembly protein CpaF